MKTWSSKVIKYLLFVFNLVFFITGLALLSLGIAINSANKEYESLLDERYFSTPVLLIVIGVFTFFIAFFGCCGAIKENYCMIVTFSIFLAAVFLTEIIAGITGYVLSGETYKVLDTSLNNTMVQYNKSVEVTFIWDEIQTDLECCGTHSYTDWYPILDNKLPVSCCGKQPGAIGILTCNSNTTVLWKKPCVDALTDTISKNISKIGWAGISIAMLQIIGILFACRLARNIKENYETV